MLDSIVTAAHLFRDLPGVMEAMATYGAGPESVMIGSGGFKRAFEADGRAVIVTNNRERFINEIEALEDLRRMGVPCLMYDEWVETMGWIVAVAPLCRMALEDEYPEILEELKKWAVTIYESGRVFGDLQLLVSPTGEFLLHDPFASGPGRMRHVELKVMSSIDWCFFVGVELREGSMGLVAEEFTSPPFR